MLEAVGEKYWPIYFRQIRKLLNYNGKAAIQVITINDRYFENYKKFSNYKGPLFIIHAEKDHIIPLNEAELIYNQSTSKNKELWIIDNADHNNILLHTGNDYFERVKMFIDSI